jgi:hypothetical protein
MCAASVLEFKKKETKMEDVKTAVCPWCAGELFFSSADVVKRGAMLDGSDFVRKDVQVVECVACEFIAEPLPNRGMQVVDAQRRSVHVFKAEDCVNG